MATDYDCVIVGGGIAGLMTAVRLRNQGLKVGLFDKGKFGSQASTGNHGMIHSGALYAELHPEIVGSCRQAIELFRATFPSVILSSEDAWYFGRPENIDKFARLWEKQDCKFRLLGSSEVDGIFRDERRGEFAYAASDDLVVSSRGILVQLALIGGHLGVDFHVHSPITEILVENGSVAGVCIGRKSFVSTRQVVLCAGLGTWYFAEKLSLKLLGRLKSRLDMIIAYEGNGNGLRHSILSVEFGQPTIAPAGAGLILASLYGGVQSPVRRDQRWSVPVKKVTEVEKKLLGCFEGELFIPDSGVAYMCSKTEVALGNADQWGVEPGFVVVDHGREDGIRNLWTLIPGKMTLAFHATRELVIQMLSAPCELPIPTASCGSLADADDLVDRSPWQRADI